MKLIERIREERNVKIVYVRNEIDEVERIEDKIVMI